MGRVKEALRKQEEWREQHPDAKLLHKAARAFQTSMDMHGMKPTVGQIPSLFAPMPAETAERIDLWYEERKRRRK